jgi:hypothetical protein
MLICNKRFQSRLDGFRAGKYPAALMLTEEKEAVLIIHGNENGCVVIDNRGYKVSSVIESLIEANPQVAQLQEIKILGCYCGSLHYEDVQGVHLRPFDESITYPISLIDATCEDNPDDFWIDTIHWEKQN